MSIYYIFNFIAVIAVISFTHKYLHIYQLKSYNGIRYLKYFKNKKSIFFFLCLILFVFELIFKNVYFICITNSILIILSLIFNKNLIKSLKTPLKFTRKMSRLYFFSIFTLIVLSFFKHSSILIILFQPLIPIISNMINVYDKAKNYKFIKKAQKTIKSSHTQIIAITGSNGKTSVKKILHEILATEHSVQSTPESYNTPIGIAKFINEKFKKDTEFLILEYGARHKNDIKKLCNLFGADYGIVTSITAQHMESFHSIKNICYAKQQLPIFLENKPCVFNVDNLYLKKMFDEKNFNKISVSIFENADISANSIKIDNNITSFNLTLDNQQLKIKTDLLGRHNVLNICLASAIAHKIGISKANIEKAIKNLQPIEHRLQLIRTHINIIDDSYNCSPASAIEALWVLKNFSNKKMVVTPGIVECGKEKYNINYQLGKQLYFCDYIVIVGEENKQALLDGIKATLLNKEKHPQIFTATTLENAKQYFTKLNNGDTLLILNDLPDDYK